MLIRRRKGDAWEERERQLECERAEAKVEYYGDDDDFAAEVHRRSGAANRDYYAEKTRDANDYIEP